MLAFFLACLHPVPVEGPPPPRTPPALAPAVPAQDWERQAVPSEGPVARIGGDPIILGAVDKSEIDAVVLKHMNAIRYCYTLELEENPTLSGKLVIKFVIAQDGSVSSASTKATTMNNPAVEDCVSGRFKTFMFPEPKGGGIAIVSFPLAFFPS